MVFTGGTALQLRQAWQKQQFIPLASTATVAEIIRVLAYPKFRLEESQQSDLLADYLPWCEVVDPAKPGIKVPRCRDIHDQKFIELAVAAAADFLVSGDGDLLTLQGLSRLKILSLRDFIDGL